MKKYTLNLFILSTILLLIGSTVETAIFNSNNIEDEELSNIVPLIEERKEIKEYDANNTILYEAVKTGDIQKVKHAILLSDDISAKDSNNKAALDLACEKGYKDIVKLLMKDSNSKVNFENLCNETSLHKAVICNDERQAKACLQEGIKANALNLFFMTPLHEAALKGHTNVAKLLLDEGADVNAKDVFGDTALHLAFSRRHLILAILLINKGADVTIKNGANNTPLDVGVQFNYKDMVRISLYVNEFNNHDDFKQLSIQIFDLISKYTKSINKVLELIDLIIKLFNKNIDTVYEVMEPLNQILQLNYQNPEVIENFIILNNKMNYKLSSYIEKLNNINAPLIQESIELIEEIIKLNDYYHGLAKRIIRLINLYPEPINQVIKSIYKNPKGFLYLLFRIEEKFNSLLEENTSNNIDFLESNDCVVL